MIVLKLGGSVITRKDKPTPTLHRDNLERISREIKESGVEELLIVHGAGSYGHPHAREYRIGSEIESNQELEQARLGFGVTQQSVQELNLEVCRALTHSGIPAVSISPSSFITTHKKRINRIEIGLIRKYMDLGFVPILYGDVVLEEDLKIKMAVLSGDQILKYMALHLGARRVILGTDVDGIYNRNPKTHPQAQLIPLVRSEDDLDFPGESNHMDVTGGMGGKLAELLELADRGIESEIINANQEGLLEKALRGERVTGTIITKKNI
jgi:isopentenyl phosphate kinase